MGFVGAAQTFGRLCALPFPSLLAETMGIEVLNLGHGGAGPEFFFDQAYSRLFGLPHSLSCR